MKCGIITFHRAINYGGVLQALALQEVIAMQNIEAEVIDYYAPSIEKLYRPSLLQRFSVLNVKRFVSAILRNGNLFFNNAGFSRFRDQHLKTSAQKYFSSTDLKQSNYDVYITGSDQVWSPTCADFDKNYFLNFVEESSRKNSYAASFGVGDIPQELAGEYHNLLKDFRNISVREASGATIIQNLLDKDVPVVLDPTLLLTQEQWAPYANPNPSSEKYILLYMIAEDEELIRKAIELSKKTGYKVCYINDRLYKTKGVQNLRKVAPDQWLRLFMDAEFVFTNSFHGVAFSINFQKKFHVAPLKVNAKANSRIDNILTLLSLEDRANYDLVENEINYSCVHNVLSEEREKSLSYLGSIFQGEHQ